MDEFCCLAEVRAKADLSRPWRPRRQLDGSKELTLKEQRQEHSRMIFWVWSHGILMNFGWMHLDSFKFSWILLIYHTILIGTWIQYRRGKAQAVLDCWKINDWSHKNMFYHSIPSCQAEAMWLASKVVEPQKWMVSLITMIIFSSLLVFGCIVNSRRIDHELTFSRCGFTFRCES